MADDGTLITSSSVVIGNTYQLGIASGDLDGNGGIWQPIQDGHFPVGARITLGTTDGDTIVMDMVTGFAQKDTQAGGDRSISFADVEIVSWNSQPDANEAFTTATSLIPGTPINHYYGDFSVDVNGQSVTPSGGTARTVAGGTLTSDQIDEIFANAAKIAREDYVVIGA